MVARNCHRQPWYSWTVKRFHGCIRKGLCVLSTLQFAPLPASNGVGDLAKELAYARTFADFAGVQLATGTAPFAVALPDLATGLASTLAATKGDDLKALGL